MSQDHGALDHEVTDTSLHEFHKAPCFVRTISDQKGQVTQQGTLSSCTHFCFTLMSSHDHSNNPGLFMIIWNSIYFHKQDENVLVLLSGMLKTAQFCLQNSPFYSNARLIHICRQPASALGRDHLRPDRAKAYLRSGCHRSHATRPQDFASCLGCLQELARC